MVARRAVVRWAWRLFRRDWRQQILVLALLTLATAATILSTTAMYSLAPAEGDAEFGAANHYIRFEGRPRADVVEANVSAAREWFGEIDVFLQRAEPVPGSVDDLEFRAQDPQGAFSGPMLALQDGRYPTAAGEVAVTDDVAKTFDLEIGATFDLGGAWTVVGVVENPNDLSSEFALTSPSHLDTPDSVTILLGGSSERFDSFHPVGDELSVARTTREPYEQILATGVVLVGAAVVLLFVSLVAATGFVVLAQRRLRQLGMLAAIGASEKHIRLVMVANGFVIGAVAAALGLAIGLAAWLAISPFLETAIGYRIDSLNVPWWLVGTSGLLAVATATLAAWWPARLAARVPVTEALSGRPSSPQPPHRSAGRAVFLVLGGLACLALGDPTRISDRTFGSLDQMLLVFGGTLATVSGILLLGPLALALMAGVAGWLPVAFRLALRDLARYRARSGTALAAVSLALGIAAATIITANAAEQNEEEANLSDQQLLISTAEDEGLVETSTGQPAQQPGGDSVFDQRDFPDVFWSGFQPFSPALTQAEFATLQNQADRIAGMFDDATVTTLAVATDPAVQPTQEGQLSVTLAAQRTDGGYVAVPLYVATEELLGLYELNLGSLDPDTEVITVPVSERLPSSDSKELASDELYFVGASSADSRQISPERVTEVQALAPGYSSLPGSFITADALRDRGWQSLPVGWLVQASEPVTSEQLGAARRLASDAGLVIEARREQASLATVRTGAAAVGMLAALSVLAMTVGLIRSEATRDLRTLSAVGATSMIRRTLTGATAGALAFLGGLLGTAGAYLILSIGYFNDLGDLTPVPTVHLLAIVVGIPLVAAFCGWLLAGRQPPALARQAIE